MPQSAKKSSKGKPTDSSSSNGQETAKKARSKPKKKAVLVEQEEKREIKWDRIVVNICDKDNDGPIYAKKAKEMLGWETEKEFAERVLAAHPEASDREVTFGDRYLLTDMTGQKVRCHKNPANRPFNDGWARLIAQDILNKHWQMNGESIVIGSTDVVLSGQHRLVGLILAQQIWAGSGKVKESVDTSIVRGVDSTDAADAEEREGQAAYWHDKWGDQEPCIESIVVCGVDESPETTRTLDNVRRRSLSDVLFSDNEVFTGKAAGRVIGPKERELLCRILDFSVRCLWQRTGAKKDPYAPYRTHSEALDFIDRHKGLLKCVAKVWELYQSKTKDKDGDDKKAKSLWAINCMRLGPGYAAGLLYLMATSKSDPKKYHEADPPREFVDDEGKTRLLSWSMWERAVKFWKRLCDGEPWGVKTSITRLPDNKVQRTKIGTVEEVSAIIARAWQKFAAGEDDPYADDLDLIKADYDLSKLTPRLAVNPTCGGIDQGNPHESLVSDTIVVEKGGKRTKGSKSEASKGASGGSGEKDQDGDGEAQEDDIESDTAADGGGGKEEGGGEGDSEPEKGEEQEEYDMSMLPTRKMEKPDAIDRAREQNRLKKQAQDDAELAAEKEKKRLEEKKLRREDKFRKKTDEIKEKLKQQREQAAMINTLDHAEDDPEEGPDVDDVEGVEDMTEEDAATAIDD